MRPHPRAIGRDDRSLVFIIFRAKSNERKVPTLRATIAIDYDDG